MIGRLPFLTASADRDTSDPCRLTKVGTRVYYMLVMRLGIIMAVLIALLAAPPVMVRASISGTKGSAAIYCIDPPDTLHDLDSGVIVFAHGFVRPDNLQAIP